MAEPSKQRPEIIDPFAGSLGAAFGFESEAQVPAVRGNYMPAVGPATDQAMAQIITRQKVAVKRDRAEILATMKSLALQAGPAYFYSIPYKDRKTGKTVRVEGPSIKLAVDLAREYGNCAAECVVQRETPTHWTLAARFVDYETGFTYSRPFNQRRNQNTGLKDTARQEDSVFQIAVSKAIRNVIVGALRTYADDAMAHAKSGLLQRINGKPEAARGWLVKQFERLEIPLAWVERQIGRKAADWLVPDMARLYGEVGSIDDDMVDWRDIYPDPNAADVDEDGVVIEQKKAEPKKAKPAAKAKAQEPQPEPEPETAKEPDPEPEPEPEAEPEAAAEPDDEPPAEAEAEQAETEEAENDAGDEDGDDGFDELNFQ